MGVPPRRKARKIFISYSREGGQADALNLYQNLVQVLGEGSVFFDVSKNAMEAGRSWKDSVRESLAGCDTLVLVLDPGMAARLAEPGSAIVFEVEAAAEAGVPIASIRVGDAELPPASTLPPSLRDLPEWHSLVVHSDAAVSDVERIVEHLTGRIPGQPPAVDRWDSIILGILVALGAVAWASSERFALSTSETWLWGALVFLPWPAWMAARRVLSTGSRGRASWSRRQPLGWLVVLIVFAAGWSLARGYVYALPEVDGGILVSRIDGDRGDMVQRELAERLVPDVQVAASQDSAAPREVALLPARVGFSSRFELTPRLDDGHAEARSFGRRAGAAVVLWGKLQSTAQAVRRLAINLTFIDSEALFRTTKARVVGAIDGGDLSGLEGDLDRLARTLPEFLQAYGRYHGAEDERDLEQARLRLTRAIAMLERRSKEQQGESRALDELLASLHFYRGNAHQALGDSEAAASDYETAIDRTAEELGGVIYPRYVEASNNRGWLAKKNGATREAISVLTAVDSLCEDDPAKRACAYVWYNLGDAFGDLEQHEKATRYLELARQRIQATSSGVEDRRLEAYCHQNLAYSLVRRAATAPEGTHRSMLEAAEESWNLGVETLRNADLEVPPYFGITQGRIHVERREWDRAIAVLSELDVPDTMQKSLHALLAGAYFCAGDTERSHQHVSSLVRSLPGAGSGAPDSDGLGEVGRISKLCGTAL